MLVSSSTMMYSSLAVSVSSSGMSWRFAFRSNGHERHQYQLFHCSHTSYCFISVDIPSIRPDEINASSLFILKMQPSLVKMRAPLFSRLALFKPCPSVRNYTSSRPPGNLTSPTRKPLIQSLKAQNDNNFLIANKTEIADLIMEQQARIRHKNYQIYSAVVSALIIGFLLSHWGSQTINDWHSRPNYANEQNLKRALARIADLVKDADLISTDETDIEGHAYSEWSTSNSDVKPYAILYPRSTEDVSGIARICHDHRVPMVPYGAGSSVEGSFSAPHGGFTVDFSRMNRILAVNDGDMDCVVQPGVNWMDLNKKLAEEGTGLFLPMDPSPSAFIGGMIATNCSGTNAMRYGTMKDWVVNLTVVLADGTVVKTRRRPRKSSAGYDLTRLFVGAEGTLGFVTEATLKLAVVPKVTGVATVSFGDVRAASSAAVGMMREGITGLAALEIMDEAQMKVINKNGGTLKGDGKTRRLWNETPTLFLKLSGTEKSIEEDVKRVSDIAKKFGGGKLESAQTQKEKDSLWAARKEALWAMLAQRDPGTEIWSTDVAVPLSRLAEIIDLSKKESSELGLFNTVMGHVGDGNFHQSVMYHPDDAEETARVARCVKNMMTRALEMEGTVAGEHAIGIGKKESLRQEVGEETIELMRMLKGAVDPHWLMNPGKIFDHKKTKPATKS